MPYPISDNRSYGPEQPVRVQSGLPYVLEHDHTSYAGQDYTSKLTEYRPYMTTNINPESQSSLSNVLGQSGLTSGSLSTTAVADSSSSFHLPHPSSSAQTVHQQPEISPEGSGSVRNIRSTEFCPTPSTSAVHTKAASLSQSLKRARGSPPRSATKRKEKPRIELAPDQPLTTQGKPRARVFVACIQCRNRKIRCDGAKPVCHNCARRPSVAEGDSVECEYDSAPKRRGPDKVPGARQRSTRSGNGEKGRRRRRRDAESTSKTAAGRDWAVNSQTNPVGNDRTNQKPMRMEIYTGNPATAQSHASAKTEGLSLIVTDLDAYNDRQGESSYHPLSGGSSNHSSPVQHVSPISQIDGTLQNQNSSYTPPSQHIVQYAHPQSAAIFKPSGTQLFYADYVAQPPFMSSSIDQNEYDEEVDHSDELITEPSLRFTRETWWDALIDLYARKSNPLVLAVTPAVRELTVQNIIVDLRFIFRASNFWFSFINISRFFNRLVDPRLRREIQPSLILALLALSTFIQSSEHEGGAKGRAWALQLREEAQSALEASFAGRWIDENLVHASWLMAFFEISAHPAHSTDRVQSALGRLDSLVRSMSLCNVDKDDPRVSRFADRSVPAVSPGQHLQQLPDWNAHVNSHRIYHDHNPLSSHSAAYVESSISSSGCDCTSFTLGHNSSIAQEWTPLWLTTPAWQDNWSEGEIRKEECRRIVWSSMMLTAGHSSYTSACNGSAQMNLFINNPANYMVLFPGESLMSSDSPGLAKETVWALYMRSMLLWHSCIRMRLEPEENEARKAQFAVGIWLEIDRIEEALSKHTCNIERAFLFQGREFLFNARMVITHEFRRYIPQAAANRNLLFHREKAEEWLKHQASVAKQVMFGLQTVTGQPNVSITRRSFFLFWFMSQISRAMTLWTCDNTLTIALEMSKMLLGPIEHLMYLWPCPEQRRRYQDLREQLTGACRVAGLAPPPVATSGVFVPLV